MFPSDTTTSDTMPFDRVRLILASASPARLSTLRNAGLHPEVIVSEVDEESLVKKELCHSSDCPSVAKWQVELLAKAKACAVADSVILPGFSVDSLHMKNLILVVGCDSMLELEGKVLGKPHDYKVALERVLALSDKSATLHTGHWVVALCPVFDSTKARARGEYKRLEVGAVASTVVNFGHISSADAMAYVDTGEPLEVAGSFTIDGLGGAFINGISGDPHNVVGISLPLLRQLFSDLGVSWPLLWKKFS